MEWGDRSLRDALTHDHLNKNLLLVHHITENLASALQHLHYKTSQCLACWLILEAHLI
jgi:hypothetical protein